MPARLRTTAVHHPQPGIVCVEGIFLEEGQPERHVYKYMNDAEGAYAECKTVAELEKAVGPETWGRVLVDLLGAVRNAQTIEAAQQKVAS